MGLVDSLAERDVDSPETFVRWVQQTTGAPHPDVKNYTILRRNLKIFFKNNPTYTYEILCRTVLWAHNKKRRFAHIWLYIGQVKWAYASGALSDLVVDSERADTSLEDRIREALREEKREEWRYRLLGAAGPEARRGVYKEWLESQWEK